MCNNGIAGYYEEPAPKKKKKKKKKKSGISGIFEDSDNAGSVLMSIGAGMLGGAMANKGTAFVVEKVIPDSSENMKRAVKNGANAVLGTIGAVVVPNKYAKAALAGVAIDGGVDGIAQAIDMFNESKSKSKSKSKPHGKVNPLMGGEIDVEDSVGGTDDYEDRMHGTDDYEDRMHGTDDYEDRVHGVNISDILSEKEIKGDAQEEIRGVTPPIPVTVSEGRGNMPIY